MANSAKIIKKIIIKAKIQTCSPLRIGSGKTDGITDMLILKDKQGRAFIPAMSLAGVLRAKISGIYGDVAAQKLFGNIDENEGNTGNQSMIIISDIILDQDKDISRLIHRDSVKINEITGVGEKGSKYDFEAWDRGAQGTLSIETTLRQHDLNTATQINITHDNVSDIYSEMLYTIADLLTAGIQVGSLTTKGYGEIKSTEPVKCYEFDFSQKGSAKAWLNYIEDMQKLPHESYTASDEKMQMESREFYLQADFILQNSLIIRDYDENNFSDKNINDKISAIQLMSNGEYIIPGTSIKGALKSKAFDILMELTDNDEVKVHDMLDAIMGYAQKEASKRSNLYIKDIYINKKEMHNMKHSRNRIDRFTGGTIDNALFSDEPIWQTEKNKAYIKLNLHLKKCTEPQAGLMLLLLRELWQGNLPLGGGKSIGRGVLHGKKCSIKYKDEYDKLHDFYLEEKDKLSIHGDKNILESYVQKLAGECNG